MPNNNLSNPEIDDLPKSIKFCIACHESIHAKASKCHYCGTNQRLKPWHRMAQVLKWIGGISAVISLILATSRINDLFSDWQERKTAISQLVNAATLQVDYKDYKGAWNLIEEALRFNPSSSIARQQQINIAMVWLRNIRIHGNESFTDIVDKLLPTLYLGSVNVDSDIAANALSHIGWANFLRSKDGVTGLDIEEYYERALKFDPDNTYAHVMWGHWLLWPGNQIQNKETDLLAANAHFKAAIETGHDYQFVQGLQVSALLNLENDPTVKVELIKFADYIRQHNGILSPYHQSEIIRVIGKIIAPNTADLMDLDKQLALTQLIKIFTPSTLLELSKWLGLDSENKSNNTQMMINARLEELAGNQKKALSIYHLFNLENSKASSYYKEFSKQSIERLSGIDK